MSRNINIIDLFAGPGGLGEGFSAFRAKSKGGGRFQIRASVEKEASAHKTLTLRALYRAVSNGSGVKHYHDYVEGNIDKKELTSLLGDEWASANEETLHRPSALGEDNKEIHKALERLRRKHQGEPWVVIGGPPCQAYSVVGRSRNRGIAGYRAETDARHFLYREYLQVLSIMQPDVFVMENVRGILTSRVGGERIFPAIKRDLENPAGALGGNRSRGKRYSLRSFVLPPDREGLFEHGYSDDSAFVIHSERFGVPQTRHRVIILGVATDIGKEPKTLSQMPEVPVERVLAGLPPLRSRLSKGGDDPEKWRESVCAQAELIKKEMLGSQDPRLMDEIEQQMGKLMWRAPTRSRTYSPEPASRKLPPPLSEWLMNDMPRKVLNHESRGHIPGDLGRYFFSACWARAFRNTDQEVPRAENFPECLAPAHANWKTGNFADRFRVQTRGRPATTITSHISKDGHYFIHPDPKQCRSLTVREAARIQTFPDNYYFEGSRTQQYVQVGNAVPPYLARQLADIVWDILK